MYYNFLVEIPQNTGKITKNKRGNTTYIEYTYSREYIPSKKYNVAKRTTIGKMSLEDETMMYPNPNFQIYFPTVTLPEERSQASRSSCVRVGAFLVIKKCIEDYQLFDRLNYLDERGKGLLLDLATYSIISESNVAQHYTEYAYNHPLMTPEHKIYSDSTIARFLSELATEDRIDFLNNWNLNRNHNEKIYISYDSTNKNCKAGDIEKAEYGHPKNDVGAPIFNYSVAYDLNNQIPLLYESYSGSIVDVSQLQYLIKKIQGYGYKNLGFVLDRGYFSRDNIEYMRLCNYEYIIMVKGKASFIHQLIEQHKDSFEQKRSCFIKKYLAYGTTINAKLYANDEEDSYFHLYHKSSRENAELTQLEHMIQRMENMMDQYKGKEINLGKAYEHYFSLTYHEKNGSRKFYGYTEKEEVIEK